MASKRHVQYSHLADDEDDYYDGGGRDDPRFGYSLNPSNEIPWKSIALALFLLLLGCGLLFLSFFLFTGHMGGELYQAYGMFGLGILTFLPGILKTSTDLYIFVVSWVT